MYQAIVFLPLLGAILGGVIALVGARARFPGKGPVAGAENTTTDQGPHHDEPGVHGGGVIHSSHHEERVPIFTWMTAGDLKVEWSLRIDTLTAVMLVVVNTVSAFVHLYSIVYMREDPYRPR